MVNVDGAPVGSVDIRGRDDYSSNVYKPLGNENSFYQNSYGKVTTSADGTFCVLCMELNP